MATDVQHVASVGFGAEARSVRRVRLPLRRLDPVGLPAVVILVFLCVAAFAPSLFQPHSPTAQHLSDANLAPSWDHWFGTDRLGRDVFSRVLEGTRNSLVMGLGPVAIALSVGGTLGLLAGYWSRLGDLTVMRVMDMMMAFPALILALMIVAAVGARSDQNSNAAIIAIGVAFVPVFARVMRSSVLATREQLYVEAAQASGATDLRIMFRHIVPNAVRPLVVVATLSVGTAILAGASLSFIGVGTTPPEIDWGSMVSDGRGVLATSWWISTFSGLAIMLAAASINVLGDALADAMDPRSRRR